MCCKEPLTKRRPPSCAAEAEPPSRPARLDALRQREVSAASSAPPLLVVSAPAVEVGWYLRRPTLRAQRRSASAAVCDDARARAWRPTPATRNSQQPRLAIEAHRRVANRWLPRSNASVPPRSTRRVSEPISILTAMSEATELPEIECGRMGRVPAAGSPPMPSRRQACQPRSASVDSA